MLPRKSILVLLIVLTATAIWIPQQNKLLEARRTLAETKMQIAGIEERMAAARSELEISRSELAAQNVTRKEVLADVVKTEKSLAKDFPDSKWANAPARLPDWVAESPYLWLRKDIAANIPASIFEESGKLRDGIAMVFTLSEAQQKTLKTTLPRILEEYRQLELNAVEKTDEHLPGIRGEGEIMTIRIKPIPEEAARLKQQFESALVETIGQQRASLLLKVDSQWLNKYFAATKEPKTISLIRRPRGDYSISVKSANNWMSTGFPKNQAGAARHYIQPHLMPLFAEILKQGDRK